MAAFLILLVVLMVYPAGFIPACFILAAIASLGKKR